MKEIRFNGYGEIVLAAILWGSTGVFVKMLALPVTSAVFFRLAVPTLGFLIFLKFQGWKFPRSNLGGMWLLSVLNATRLFFYNFAFLNTSIGNAVIILYTWPLFVTLLSSWLLSERISFRKMLLLGLAFVGIVLVYSKKEFSLGDRDFLGALSMLGASIILGGMVVLQKKESSRFSPVESNFFLNLVGSFVYLPFFLFNDPFPTAEQYGIGIVYGVTIGIIAYNLWLVGLKKLPASSAVVMTFLEVPSAIIMSIFFFDEILTWNMILGAACIITSVLLLKKAESKA